MISGCDTQLEAWEANIRPGTILGAGATIGKLADRPEVHRHRTARVALEQIKVDLTDFRARNKLDQVVVINVSSTEPPFETGEAHQSLERLTSTLDRDPPQVPASSLYAWAALDLGLPYINFTPSLGATFPALEELAIARKPCSAARTARPAKP